MQTGGLRLVPPGLHGIWLEDTWRSDVYDEANVLYRQALSCYLASLSWTHFLTITFKRPQRDSIFTLDSTARYLMSELPYSRVFSAAERFSDNTFLHIHSLASVGDCAFTHSHAFAQRVERDLSRYYGRSRVESIRSTADVSAYCAKYVAKSTEMAYNFYGNRDSWTPKVLAGGEAGLQIEMGA